MATTTLTNKTQAPAVDEDALVDNAEFQMLSFLSARFAFSRIRYR